MLPAGHINAGGHRAAIVTAAYTNAKGQVTETAAVDLTAFLLPHEDAGPTVAGALGFAILEHVPADFDTKKPGTWHWPERELDYKDLELDAIATVAQSATAGGGGGGGTGSSAATLTKAAKGR